METVVLSAVGSEVHVSINYGDLSRWNLFRAPCRDRATANPFYHFTQNRNPASATASTSNDLSPASYLIVR